MFSKENGPCAQNMLTILGLSIDIVGKAPLKLGFDYI
jgi:hypothetical protein